MKHSSILINEALVIQITALDIGKNKVSRADLIRANELLKKAGKIIGHKIAAKSETKSNNQFQ